MEYRIKDKEQQKVIEEFRNKELHNEIEFEVENGDVTEITFWQNWIDALPESIGCLKSLKRLDLEMNNLSSLPESFRNLKVLEELILEGNAFTTFPEQLLDLPSLKWLSLSSNPIKEIPPEIERIQTLEGLDLGYIHALKSLPASLANLKNLEILRLEQCYDVVIPEEVRNIPHLEIEGLDDLKVNEYGAYNIELLIREFGTPKVSHYADEKIRNALIRPNDIVIRDEIISIEFSYPLHNPVSFKYTSKGGFTRLALFKCIYEGYKKIYDEEETEVGDPGTYERVMNRKPSNGKYGIWGHYMSGLFIERITYDPTTKNVSMFIGS